MREWSARLPRGTADVGLPLLTTLFVVAAMWRVGIDTTVFLVVLLLAVVLGTISQTAFATIVIVIAPLPQVGDLVGVTIPVGLDPLDALVVLGVGLLLMRDESLTLSRRRAVVPVIGLNLALLVLAWYRTYGQGALSGQSIALIIKPVIVVAVGFLVVKLLPPLDAVRIVATAMAVGLLAVATSVALQRVGLYHTAHQVQNLDSLGIKQYGGLLLDGNAAGGLLAVFMLPVWTLLRSVDRPVLARTVMMVAIPVLLITLARGAIVAFAASLLALALFDRQHGRGVRVALLVAIVSAGWASTAGRAQTDEILQSLTRDNGNGNAVLSGRLSIWDQARQYLLDGGHWFWGGGLDAFRDYTAASTLGHAFATHNMYLYLLVTGGVVMTGAVALLMVTLWRAAGSADRSVGIALKLSIVGSLVLGLSSDVNLFAVQYVWVWVLTALAVAPLVRAQNEPARGEDSGFSQGAVVMPGAGA